MNQAKKTFITAGALLALIVKMSWGCEPYYDRDYDRDRYGRHDGDDRDRDRDWVNGNAAIGIASHDGDSRPRGAAAIVAPRVYRELPPPAKVPALALAFLPDIRSIWARSYSRARLSRRLNCANDECQTTIFKRRSQHGTRLCH